MTGIAVVSLIVIDDVVLVTSTTSTVPVSTRYGYCYFWQNQVFAVSLALLRSLVLLMIRILV